MIKAVLEVAILLFKFFLTRKPNELKEIQKFARAIGRGDTAIIALMLDAKLKQLHPPKAKGEFSPRVLKNIPHPESKSD